MRDERSTSLAGEPHSEWRRGVLGVLLGIALGAIALVFRRRSEGR